jgi:hypothetical membrane protein
MTRQQIVEDDGGRAAPGARMRAAPGNRDAEEVGRGAAHGLEPRPIAVVVAAAGILGPILFTAAFVIQELLRRGEYSPMAERVSALEAGPGGWVQQVNFVGFGLLTIAFAVGLHRGMRPTRAGVIGPAILAWTGVELVLTAVFPLREDAAGLAYDPTGLHDLNGAILFVSVGVGFIVLSRRMAADPRWGGLATYALATGIAWLVLLVTFGVLVMPDDAPLHPWAGLAQRVVLAVWFSCTIVLALRLLRVTRAADPQR